jgi:protein-disulfide isomerase
MIKTRHLLLIFIPAILLASFILFIRIIQYEPLYQKITNTSLKQELVPILPNDPIVGNKRAPITIVAFEDFNCEHCKYQNGLLDKLMETYPNQVKIVWKSISSKANEGADDYAYCANKQGKFTEFKQLAFANQNNLTKNTLDIIATELSLNQSKLEECLISEDTQKYNEINKNIAISLHIQFVPTFFIDNKQITTPESLIEWQTVLGLN